MRSKPIYSEKNGTLRIFCMVLGMVPRDTVPRKALPDVSYKTLIVSIITAKLILGSWVFIHTVFRYFFYLLLSLSFCLNSITRVVIYRKKILSRLFFFLSDHFLLRTNTKNKQKHTTFFHFTTQNKSNIGEDT